MSALSLIPWSFDYVVEPLTLSCCFNYEKPEVAAGGDLFSEREVFMKHKLLEFYYPKSDLLIMITDITQRLRSLTFTLIL